MCEKVSRTDVERHVEKYVRDLVTNHNQPGGFVDIPFFGQNGHDIDFMQAIALWTSRLIRKPLGNRNGTYKMSTKPNPGHTRITLVDKIP